MCHPRVQAEPRMVRYGAIGRERIGLDLMRRFGPEQRPERTVENYGASEQKVKEVVRRDKAPVFVGFDHKAQGNG